MSFAMPWCGCCHRKITHRLFDDTGSLIWSKRDRNAWTSNNPSLYLGIALSKAGIDVWTTSYRNAGTATSLLQWDVSGIIDDSTSLPDGTGGGDRKVVSDSSGNIYVGHSATAGHETIVKLDSNLDEVWRFVSPGHAGSRTAINSEALVLSPDESRLACITYLSKPGYANQGRIAELDTSGAEQWSYTFNPSDESAATPHYPIYTIYDPAGNLWAATLNPVTIGGLGTGNWVRFDGTGTPDRVVSFLSSTFPDFIQFDSAGNVYLLSGSSPATWKVEKYDDTGAAISNFSIDTIGTSGFKIDPNDNIYLLGPASGVAHRLACYSLAGSKLWSYDETVPASVLSSGLWFLAANDGYVAVAGPVREE